MLVFVQILLGALVAGLKAGMAYNTWPLMDGRLIPDGLGIMRPWYLNLFENAMAVQFNHRMVAYAVALAVAWHTWSTLRSSGDVRVRSTAVVLAAANAAADPARHLDAAGAGAAVPRSGTPGRRGGAVRNRRLAHVCCSARAGRLGRVLTNWRRAP